jgi:hypothetical protein
MNRLCLTICAVLVMSSCTPVEDFGLYWDKGFLDPALAGSWKKVGPAGEDSDSVPCLNRWRFTRSGTNYSAQSINPIDQAADPQEIAEQKAENERALSVRTLRIGKSLFLMQSDPADQGKGAIVRYEVRRGVLNEYWIDNGASVDFVQAKYPTAKNIKATYSPSYVAIGTFDDEVFRALSEIADNPTYWVLTCSYKKVP